MKVEQNLFFKIWNARDFKADIHEDSKEVLLESAIAKIYEMITINGFREGNFTLEADPYKDNNLYRCSWHTVQAVEP